MVKIVGTVVQYEEKLVKWAVRFNSHNLTINLLNVMCKCVCMFLQIRELRVGIS